MWSLPFRTRPLGLKASLYSGGLIRSLDLGWAPLCTQARLGAAAALSPSRIWAHRLVVVEFYVVLGGFLLALS